jgi:hypothetical protein
VAEGFLPGCSNWKQKFSSGCAVPSTVALDITTGAYKWQYQTNPVETGTTVLRRDWYSNTAFGIVAVQNCLNQLIIL